MSEIELLLKKDLQERKITSFGKEIDLIPLDITFKPVDVTYPILVEHNKTPKNPTQRFYGIANSKTVTLKLRSNDEILKRLDMTNIVLAGGSVTAAVCGYTSHGSDLDFFIYGISDVAQATKRLLEFVGDLREKLSEDLCSGEDGSGITIIRSFGAITIFSGEDDGTRYQVILRLYPTISDVLRGFDLGCCAVGWDGKNVYTTPLGKYCLEHGVNIIDTTRRSTSYEFRLAKYFARGFSIILPSLDITDIVEESIFTLGHPKFKITVEKIIGKILSSKVVFDSKYGVSDYEGNTDTYHVMWNNMRVIKSYKQDHKNQWVTDENNNPSTTLAWKFDDLQDVKEILVFPFNEMIIKLRKFYEKALKCFKDEAADCKDPSDRIHITKLKYVSVTLDNLISGLTSREWEKYIDKVFEKEIEKMEEVIKFFSSFPQTIQWRTEQPGSQIVGSYNPIIEDESIWYGDYYLKKEISQVEKKRRLA